MTKVPGSKGEGDPINANLVKSHKAQNSEMILPGNHTYEDVLAALGTRGRYQILLFLLMLSLVFTIGCHFKFMIYGGIFPKEMPCPTLNETVSNDYAAGRGESFIEHTYEEQASKEDQLTNQGVLFVASEGTNGTCYDLRNIPYHSIAAEWHLVGSRSYLVSTVISVQMAGVFVGPLIGGMIADRFGRKPVIIGTSFFMLIFGVAAGFCNSWQVFAFIRFFIGLFAGAALTTGFVFTTENLLGTWRLALNSLPWPLNYFFFTLTAWLTKDWVWHSWVINIPVVFALMFAMVISESPKWLLARGRKEEARATITRIGRFNRVPREKLTKLIDTNAEFSGHLVPGADQATSKEMKLLRPECNGTVTDGSAGFDSGLDAPSADKKENQERGGVTYSYFHLFVEFRPAIQCIMLMFCFIAAAGNYYAILFNVGNLTNNPYMLTLILACIEACFNLLATGIDFKVAFCGRRMMLFFGIAAAATADVILVIITALDVHEKVPWAAAIPSIAGLSLTTFFWVGSVMMSVEMFPTELRNMGSSMSHIGIRIGAIIGPQLFNLNKLWTPASYTFYAGFLSLVGIGAFFLLPETKNRPLPDLSERIKQRTGSHRGEVRELNLKAIVISDPMDGGAWKKASMADSLNSYYSVNQF